MKKDDAIKEIGRLTAVIQRLEAQDKDVRRNLTNLFKGYLNYNSFDKHTDMTWIEIAFHIGELRADADIHCMLQREQNLREELRNLKEAKHL